MARSVEPRIAQDSIHRPTLFLAFELITTTWKLGFTRGGPSARGSVACSHVMWRPCGRRSPAPSSALGYPKMRQWSAVMRQVGTAFGFTTV
jgi:hypothetical protein